MGRCSSYFWAAEVEHEPRNHCNRYSGDESEGIWNSFVGPYEFVKPAKATFVADL